MIKQVAIVGQTRDRGQLFLDWFTETRKNDVKTICKNINRSEIILNNGDLYRNIPANDSSRGCRFHQVFIEMGTNQDVVNYIVRPFLMEHDNVNEEDMIIYFFIDKDKYYFYRPIYGREYYENIGISINSIK